MAVMLRIFIFIPNGVHFEKGAYNSLITYNVIKATVKLRFFQTKGGLRYPRKMRFDSYIFRDSINEKH